MGVEIEELSPKVIGKKLGQNLYNPTGNLLLRKGVIIKPYYYNHFKKEGYRSIYLLNNHSNDIEATSHFLSDRLQATAPFSLKNIFRLLNLDDPQKATAAKSKLFALARSLLLNVNYNIQKLPKILDLKRHEDYLYQHSINVAVYAILIGHRLQYNETRLLNLVLAALLHDFGMLFVDNKIVNKSSQIEDAEFETIKAHTTKGFHHLFRKCSFDGLSALATVQHHERFDGTGYPKELSGKDIHEYSRIISLTDFFDAWTSDRPHRRLHTIDEAIEFIKNNEGKIFDPILAHTFVRLFE
ncbi:MAG: HD-GYP domain-containing protein [bacterium]